MPATCAASGKHAAIASVSARSHHAIVVGAASATLDAHRGVDTIAASTPTASALSTQMLHGGLVVRVLQLRAA